MSTTTTQMPVSTVLNAVVAALSALDKQLEMAKKHYIGSRLSHVDLQDVSDDEAFEKLPPHIQQLAMAGDGSRCQLLRLFAFAKSVYEVSEHLYMQLSREDFELIKAQFKVRHSYEEELKALAGRGVKGADNERV